MIADTRQNWPLCRVPKKTLGKGSVTVTWRRDGDFSLPSTKWHSANARQKVLGKEAVADVQFAERSLPSVTLGKVFAECFLGFAECLRHSTKELCPVVLEVICTPKYCIYTVVIWKYLHLFLLPTILYIYQYAVTKEKTSTSYQLQVPSSCSCKASRY
jgi:hypothetical protein